MGVSGVAVRQVPFLSGAVYEGRSSKASLSVPPRVSYSVHAANRFSGEELRISRRCSVSSNPRRAFGFLDCGFSDNGHLDYYRAKPRCGVKKDKDFGAMKTKKKLKLLKGLLSQDLISEAGELLIKQLQQVRSSEKEMKRRKKSKASRGKESSSSSESESEGGEVMDMSRLRREVLELPLINATPNSASSTQQGDLSGLEDRSALVNESSSSSTSTSSCCSVSAKSIEVCMGGKCKRSGGAALLEEFERVVGVEGAVVGCKCMGKCRDGPNVRTPSSPLCVKVGLEDVDLIVARMLGEKEEEQHKDLGLAVAC